MKIKLILSLSILLMAVMLAFAHGGKDHKKKKKNTVKTETEQQVKQTETYENPSHAHSYKEEDSPSHNHNKIKADLDDFPSLHPLAVHFPVVLLLLAALAQLASLFVMKKELSIVVLILLAFGLVSTFIAVELVHPHTADLTDKAAKVLEEHEEYADFTLWLSSIAFLLKIISHFFLKRKLWAEIIICIVLIASAYYVGLTGHYGAQLTHLEGVGVKGNFLELHGEHEH